MAPPSTHPLATGAAADWYRVVIGPQGQDYYLGQFKRFDADGRTSLGWNGPAFWATLGWMLYRRMWGPALAYLAVLAVLVLLVFGAGRLVFDYSYARAVLLLLLLLPLTLVVPALYGDAWYYRHCQRRIAAALRRAGDADEARETLARQAPGPRSLQALVLAHVALLAFALLGLNELRGADNASIPAMAAQEPALSAAPAALPPEPPAVTAAEPAVPAPVRVASAPAPAASQAQAPVSPVVVSSTMVTTAAPAPRADAARPVWVVQVGAYAQPENAREALRQLQALGLEAQVYESRRSRLIRVRVGPYPRQAEAEQAARRIREQQLPALVLRQRP